MGGGGGVATFAKYRFFLLPDTLPDRNTVAKYKFNLSGNRNFLYLANFQVSGNIWHPIWQ